MGADEESRFSDLSRSRDDRPIAAADFGVNRSGLFSGLRLKLPHENTWQLKSPGHLRIVDRGQSLTEPQVLELLSALKASTLTAPHPLMRLVKAEGQASGHVNLKNIQTLVTGQHLR